MTTSKVQKLEAQAKLANAVVGATGEPKFAATGIVSNHRVRVVYTGYDHSQVHYEVTAPDGTLTVAASHAATLSLLGA
jgi:hypothetical protein